MPASEPTVARDALTAFLSAEVEDRAGESPERSAQSFALLDAATQERYGSVAAWRHSRAERLVPATFTITAERGSGATAELNVVATRPPSITPFRGLVAAETTEVWLVEATDDGRWRVQGGRPHTATPKLPSEAAAVAATQRWIDGAARCDRSILELQVARTLLGASELSQLACEAKGAWSTAEPVPLGDLPDITTFVAAYGAGVARWGRGVEVASGNTRFTVILGPVGNEWQVMGLLASERTR